MRCLILTGCMIISCIFSYGQDSHYWNMQYGAKATLLGGAVIGSVSDLSATYYNPGAVSLFDDPSVILSAKVYQYEKMTVINGAGNNKNLDYSSITPSPTFVAFNVKIDSTGKNKLAFSVLTRQTMNFEFATRKTQPDGNMETGTTYTTGGLSMNQDFKEIWTGATLSHRMSQTIGLGLTTYIAYRNQTTQFQTIVEELKTDKQIASILAYRKLEFTNYRALLKGGLAINLKPVTLGLTVTTPSLNIFGSGSYGYHNFINMPNHLTDNIYQTNAQDELQSQYKTSWAIGFGVGYWGKKTTIHFSAEWYNAVGVYHPFTLDPFQAQSSGNTIQKEINQGFKSVLNAGLGMEYQLKKGLSFAGSFNTDFSANIDGLESNISLSRWDIYHFSAGSNFNIGKAEITLGLSYSGGSDTILQNSDDKDPGYFSEKITQSADVRFSRIKVLFGFVF